VSNQGNFYDARKKPVLFNYLAKQQNSSSLKPKARWKSIGPGGNI